MKKMVLALTLALALGVCGAAVAEQGVAYGVYSLGNEQPDSLIRVTLDCDGETVTGVQIDEKLIPYSASGAEGWAELDAETAAKLGGEVNGESVELMDYICTDEGGVWYYESNPATLLNAQGEAAAEIEIGTKASIEHGVAFWPSDIKFPGNIERIENYLTENGVNYTEDQIVKGEDGVWNVADVVTGATLAGTKNYLLIAQRAYANAQGK